MASFAEQAAAFERSVRLDIGLALVRDRRAQLAAAIAYAQRRHDDELAKALVAEMLALPGLFDLGELDDAGQLEAEIERLKMAIEGGFG
jgi:hypothetical protein